MSNGWLKMVTSLELLGSMPFLFSAANSSGWFPQHQTPTVLPAIFLIVLIPLVFHVSSVMPLRVEDLRDRDDLPPFSRVANRSAASRGRCRRRRR